MSYFDRRRYERKQKEHGSHFGKDDIIFSNIRANSVYVYPPKEWEEKDVIDFYVDNGKDIYFLKVICSRDNFIRLNTSVKIKYYIVETELDIRKLENLQVLIETVENY